MQLRRRPRRSQPKNETLLVWARRGANCSRAPTSSPPPTTMSSRPIYQQVIVGVLCFVALCVFIAPPNTLDSFQGSSRTRLSADIYPDVPSPQELRRRAEQSELFWRRSVEVRNKWLEAKREVERVTMWVPFSWPLLNVLTSRKVREMVAIQCLIYSPRRESIHVDSKTCPERREGFDADAMSPDPQMELSCR
jgi:hypothetical protein